MTQKGSYSRIEFVVHSVQAKSCQESDHSLLVIAGTATRNGSTWARMRYVGRGDELEGSRVRWHLSSNIHSKYLKPNEYK